MACSANLTDSSGVAGKRMLANAIRNVFIWHPDLSLILESQQPGCRPQGVSARRVCQPYIFENVLLPAGDMVGLGMKLSDSAFRRQLAAKEPRNIPHSAVVLRPRRNPSRGNWRSCLEKSTIVSAFALQI